MSIRLTRPSPETLRTLLDAGKVEGLQYRPIGLSDSTAPPDGFRLNRRSSPIGQGAQVFGSASRALELWDVHRGAGLSVLADGPPAFGSVVAMGAPLPVGFVDAVCRVIEVVDRPDRFGFTYGTLSVHPVLGEESFTVVRAADDTITFEIVAVSRPRHGLARALPPVARKMQRSATKRYMKAMRTAVAA